MKRVKLLSLAVMMVSLFVFASCADDLPVTFDSSPSSGQIFLYGEAHGEEKILARELELWGDYYHNDGMRHLFIEYPYYTAEFLNIWMKADNDDILNDVYNDWIGTLGHDPDVKAFFKQIKHEYPETIFHGTDVGHCYETAGARYLSYLEESGLEDSYHYSVASEVIAQGMQFYKTADNDYIFRENKMVENFAREFDGLDGENVMGIYGSAHTYLDGISFASDDHPCMANQLKERYGIHVHTEDLSRLVNDIIPLRIDTLIVNGKEYEASYFGKEDISSLSQEYIKREFWRLENAYNDFVDCSKTGKALPYDNYPMWIETGQVFVVEYTELDGSVMRMYFRSDGNKLEWQPATDQFVLE